MLLLLVMSVSIVYVSVPIKKQLTESAMLTTLEHDQWMTPKDSHDLDKCLLSQSSQLFQKLHNSPTPQNILRLIVQWDLRACMIQKCSANVSITRSTEL